MPDTLRQTILGDVRGLINDAWDFFAPPLIKVCIAAFFFWYVCGSGPLLVVSDNTRKVAASLGNANLPSILDKYNLTALLPLAVLFLFAVLAYVANRIILGVAALVPINIGYTGDRIERMIHEDPFMQKQLAPYPPYSGDVLIEQALAKARSQKEEALLQSVDNAQQQTSRNAVLFGFAKFLLAWTVACAVFSLTIASATPFTYGRVSLLLFAVIVFGIYAACKFAKTVEYLGYARIQVVRIMLMKDEPPAHKFEVSDSDSDETDVSSATRTENRQARIEFLRQRSWWFLNLRLMDWWEMLRYFRYHDTSFIGSDKRRFSQAILRNGANTLWFIVGAVLVLTLGRFSWWLGVLAFIAYVSVTISDCVLITVLIAINLGKTAATNIRSKLPQTVTDFLPGKPTRERIYIREDTQYLVTEASIRLFEGLLAIALCRLLANHFFH